MGSETEECVVRELSLLQTLRIHTTKKRAHAIRMYMRHRSLRRAAKKMGVSHEAVRQLLIAGSIDLSVATGRHVDVMLLANPTLK